MRHHRASLTLSLAIVIAAGCAGKSVTNVTPTDGGSAGQTSHESEGGTTAKTSAAGQGGTHHGGGGTNTSTAQGGSNLSTVSASSTSVGGTAGQGGFTNAGGASSGGATSGGAASGGTAGTSNTTAPSCTAAPAAWKGCFGSGCKICNELVTTYPLYFIRHKNCDANLNCGGLSTYEACSENCPEPTEDDRYGGTECAGTQDGWLGCRGSGCLVCSELLNAFPRYLVNHPSCGANLACQGTGYARCSASCPEPTDADR